MVTVRYFASLRERIGCESESLQWSEEWRTVDGLRAWLCARGDAWADAFSPDRPLMSAVNEELAMTTTVVADGDDVAFFPPVTGG